MYVPNLRLASILGVAIQTAGNDGIEKVLIPTIKFVVDQGLALQDATAASGDALAERFEEMLLFEHTTIDP